MTVASKLCQEGDEYHMGENGELGTNNEVVDVKEANETPEEASEIDDEISDQYNEYLANDKAQNFEHKSMEEKEASREEIEEASPYSIEVTDNIRSKEELDVYLDAGLQEENVNGKTCLIKSDIDMNQKDEFGLTNAERMENGHSPISKDGQTVELHHVGQKNDSPLAELTTQEHRGKGNDTILHDKAKPTEIDRTAFNTEREEHWKDRANNN